jgi:glycosyltransferase involved in cell wall biosynthesis
MRVAYVLRFYPVPSETFIYDELAGLLDRGLAVDILAMGPFREPARHAVLARLAPRFPPRRPLYLPILAGALRALTRPAAWSAAAWLAARQPLKQVLKMLWAAAVFPRPDRVHAHFAGEAAEVGLALARAWDVPFSLTTHAADLHRPRPSVGEVLSAARPHVTISDANAALVRERWREPSVVVRLGVAVAARARGGGGILAVGRLVEKKGFDLLMAAMRTLPEARCTVVGTGPVRLEAPDNVRLAGSATHEEVLAALQTADLFVLPCRRAADGDQDGIPVALMEAMAAGVAVVTTRAGGIAELVDESVGWLVERDDSAGLARALAAAMADPAERSRRGTAGQERVRRAWTREAHLDGLLAAWAQSTQSS